MTGQIHDLDISFYQSGTVRPLILFGKFKDAADPFYLTKLKDRNGNETQSSADILNPDHVGSLAHYFKEMSYGALTLEDNDDGVEGVWFEAARTKATDYGPTCLDGIQKFAKEVFADADDTIDFSDYDRDGDEVVDLVILYIPKEFRADCRFNGVVFTNSGSKYPTGDSVSISDNVIYVIQRPSFPYLVGVTAHEYGHVINLPDLYDKSVNSAGIGLWSVMGAGPLGWSPNFNEDLFSGPNPLSVWSRYKVGWITSDNGRLVTVESDATNATLNDINSKSSTVKAYKIPVRDSEEEYFLMANRQNTHTENSRGSYYDDLAPASGLAIWHIDDGLPISGGRELRFDTNNNNEKHKRVDLECADGLYDDGGFGTPGNSKNSISGGDNLDYLSADATYTADNNGNLGDATDVWDGSTYTKFTPDSNPSTAGYNGNSQDVFTGIAVRNIQARPNGVMQVDIVFLPLEPRNLRAEAGAGQVTLRWAAPMPNGGSAITGYEYRQSLDGGRTWTTRTPVVGGATARSQIVGELTAGTLYTFEVRGVNASGSGGWASATAMPVPSAPSATVTAGFRRIHVDWTPVASVTGYDVQVQSKPFDRGTWPTAWSPVATNTAGRIPNNRPSLRRETHTGVSPDNLYRYQVRSRAGAAVSAWSALVPDAAGIQPGVGAPTEFRAEAGVGQVTLRWTGPDHASITQWRYRDVTALGADTEGGWQDLVVRGSASTEWSAPVEGLTPGQAYRFQLRAVNGAGGGQPSAVSNTVTPRAPVCSLTGELAPTFAENATGVVSTYTASAGCGSALSWVLEGTDASAFKALQGTGMSRTLEFNDPPNFERPADDGANNTYAVSVALGDVSVAVVVSVTDANDSGLIRLSTTSPQAGQSLTATLSDEDGIEEPVYWTPHYGSASDGGGVASEATQTWVLIIPNRRVGQPLRIQADYTDSFGAASATSARTSPVRAAPNRAPSVSGPAAVEVAENSLAPWLLGTYIGRDADGDDLTWSITGRDARAFAELKEPASPGTQPSRELHLASTPDYEAQASYDVWVKVSDAALSDSLRVSVSVLNQNEAGAVVLTGGLPPEVGTAVVAALTDPDGGITGASWQWQRRLGATGSWEDIGSGVSGASSAVSGTASTYPELSSYTPVQADVGWQLQATVRYRDGHDSSTERTAESTASVAVIGPPSAPSGVSVRSGWAQVRVEWPAVASATDYAVQRQGKPFDRGPWPSAWTSLASALVGRPRYVDRGVSPDSLYRYQVRVRVGALVSAWSAPQPSSGVQPGVGPPTGFTAEAGASRATLRWTGPDHASITKWRYRDVTALGADTQGGWKDLVVRGSALTEWSAPVDGLTPGREYRFQVRAANGAGGGHPSAVSNTITPWLARPTGGSVSVKAGPVLEVSWSSVASATGYEVQGQSKPFDGESWPSTWTTQQANGTQPYVHQGVDADRRYRYRVRARVGETASAWSDTLPGVAGVQPPPGAPTGLTATPGNRQVRLTWTGPTHQSITEWQVKRGQILEPITAWAGWRSISTAATTRSYTVQTGLENGKSYIFQLRVRNGGGWSAAARSDTVALPADTKGRVSLSTTAPQVGDKLTATLTDPDNPTDARFTWSFFRPAGASGANGADPPPSAVQSEPLPVSTVYLGLQILARVSYTDDYGRQQAHSAKTAAVVGPPWAPRAFTATAGDGQAALTWTAPLRLGGSAITGYKYRYKQTSGSWPDSWTSAGTSTSATVSSLTNGTAYSFEVRAVNRYGDGTVASAAATPTPVCSPASFTATAGDGQVSLGWDAPSGSPCAAVTGYEYRYKQTSGSWPESWTSAGTSTSATVSSLTNGTPYSFEVRTVAGQRTSRAVSASATPQVKNRAPDVWGPASVSIAENSPPSTPLGTYTASDEDGDELTWSVTGTDASAFELKTPSPQGTNPTRDLHFRSAPDYETKSSYQVSVQVSDGSLSDSQSVSVSVIDKNDAPELKGLASASIPENSLPSTSLGTYTASDEDGDALTWSVTGTEASAFELKTPSPQGTNPSRTLHFRSAPNYEAKNSYTVWVQVADAALSDSLMVSVSVTNENDPGSVTLAPDPPQVGKKLIATLKDDDGRIVVSRWSWERFPEPFGAAGASGLATGEYTPAAGEVGQYVRVTVYYTDGHGENKQAQSAQTAAIVDVPGAPRDFTATAGDGQVALSWKAPLSDGGSAITGYTYRSKKSVGGSWPDRWTSAGTSTSATVSSLTNGTAYSFEVRAVNAYI